MLSYNLLRLLSSTIDKMVSYLPKGILFQSTYYILEPRRSG